MNAWFSSHSFTQTLYFYIRDQENAILFHHNHTTLATLSNFIALSITQHSTLAYASNKSLLELGTLSCPHVVQFHHDPSISATSVSDQTPQHCLIRHPLSDDESFCSCAPSGTTVPLSVLRLKAEPKLTSIALKSMDKNIVCF